MRNIMKEDVCNIPVWVKVHDILITAFTKEGLNAIATKLDTPLDSYTSTMFMDSWGSTIHVEYKRRPPRCSSFKVFSHVLDECSKKIVSDVLKNSKSPRQDVEGVHVGLKNFEQLKDTCNYDPYDDDDFDDCGLTDTQMKFANSFDICLPGQIR
ncbi:hypothetical protein Tco_1070872 [Tanacetum coccineum]|uniref:DUF4283 domain-containing protein n=1 Tax=Tanacetum coccineum TaxID=301880 RepID=A0ABQ5HMX7_9ASTR